MVAEPAESVVTKTTPDSVTGLPSEFVVVKVVVTAFASVGKRDVDVVAAPAESVVTTTIPDSVIGFPLESVVV